MPIFWASSGILKIVMILFIRTPSLSLSFRRPRLHLVSLRFLARRNDLDRASLGSDLLGRRLGKMVGADNQAFRHFPVAQNAHAVCPTLGQAGLAQGFRINRVA